MNNGFREIKYRKPRDKLEEGARAYFQIIYEIAKSEVFISIDDIFRSLVEDYGVMTKEPFCREYVKNLVDEMNEKGHLLPHKGEYKAVIPIEGNNRYIKLKEGFDPIAYHIVNTVKNRGGISRKDLKTYMVEGIGIVGNSKIFDWYIDELRTEREDCKFLKNKVIEVKNGWVEKVGTLRNNLELLEKPEL